MRNPGDTQARPEPWLAAAGLIILWLGTRGYEGITHDARLYAVQALALLDPGRFAGDLFFAYGSQDSFTLFSRVYAPLIAWQGLGRAHALLFALGHAAWFTALWWLAVGLIPDARLRLWSVAAVIVLPSSSSALGVFGYAEGFVTPRLFAEALIIAAIAAWLHRRRVVAILLVPLAGMLHPLVALPGLGVLVFLHCLSSRRLAIGVATAAAVAILVLPLLPISVRSTIGMLDEPWQSAVALRSPWLFVREWNWLDWVRLAIQALLALGCAIALRGEQRKLVVAALITATLGIMLTFFGADLAQLQPVAAAQPWRGLWILVLTVNLLLLSALAGPRAVTATRAALPRAVILAALCLLALNRTAESLAIAVLPLLVLAGCLLARPTLGDGTAPRMSPLVLVIVVATTSWTIITLYYLSQIGVRALLDGHVELPWGLPRYVLLVCGGIGMLGFARAATGMARPAPAWLARLSAVVLLAVGAWTIDQRTPWTALVEARHDQPGDLETFLPPGEVYWDGGVDLVWFGLGRPSYFSCVQGTGVAFYRETAVAFMQRARSFEFQMHEGECMHVMTARATTPSRDDLARACAAEPQLDHIVTMARVEGLVPAAQWHLPVARRVPGFVRLTQASGEVFRFGCDALRGRASDATSPS
jgi:hypothetical protein